MFGSSALDIAVGLMFVYFLLAAITSHVVEGVAAILAWRADRLEKALVSMLGKDAAAAILNHPLVSGIDLGTKPEYGLLRRLLGWLLGWLPRRHLADEVEKPHSYISARQFSLALVNLEAELVKEQPKIGEVLNNVRVPAPPAKGGWDNVLGRKTGLVDDLAARRADYEAWFNDVMARASGEYKRRLLPFTALVGAILVIGLNADSIALGNALYHDQTLRSALQSSAQAVVAAAQPSPGAQATAQPSPSPSRSSATRPTAQPSPASPSSAVAPHATDSLAHTIDTIQALDLPLGWSWSGGLGQLWHDFWHASAQQRVAKTSGLGITVLAVWLGAPFWFRLLQSVVRATGAKPDDSGGAKGKTATGGDATGG